MKSKIVDIIKNNWFNKFPEQNPTEGEMSNRGANIAAEQIVKFCNIPHVNGWHLFSEKKPKHGDNIEVYYDDRTIVNVDWQDYLLNDKEYKHMRFWRACR